MKINQLSQSVIEHTMLIFLCCLIILLIMFPLLHVWISDYLGVIECFFSLLLLTGLYFLKRNSKMTMISGLIFLLSMILMWFNLILQSTNLLITALVIQIIFFLITTVTLINHVMTYPKVNAETIFGAISAYLLIAIVWAMVYTTLEIALPESFKFSHAFEHDNIFLAGHRFYFSQFLYLSIVTLTTLGYGDIVPVTLPAQYFTSLQAITGQLYVAVLIARLVGLHISHTHWERIKQEKKSG